MFGLPSLADDHPDEQSRCGQHEHQRLERCERRGIVAVVLEQSNQAELGGGQSEAGAVDTMAHGSHDDRQEQQVEKLVTACDLDRDDEP